MSNQKKRPRIFIVEDESIVARDIRQQLEKLGYEVVANTRRGEDAIQLTGKLSPDLVLMDIELAGRMKGTEAAQVIMEQFGIPLVFLTANADMETMQSAKEVKPHGYILKPFSEEELQKAVCKALSGQEDKPKQDGPGAG